MTLSLLSLVLVPACTRAPARDPAVVGDVLDYVAKIKKWEPVEARVLQALQEVRRSQFVDDDYVVATLGGVMDDMQIHLDEIERYTPKTPPVAEVHDAYRKAWNDLRTSFQTTIGCMERKDYVALAPAVEAMQKARGELVAVAADLSLLLEDAGLNGPEGGGKTS